MAFSRPLDDIRVGGEVDAKCGKCKRITNHRIVSMVEGVVKRVLCLTCESEHVYHAPPTPLATPKKATGTVVKSKSVTKPKAAVKAPEREVKDSEIEEILEAEESLEFEEAKGLKANSQKETKPTKETKAKDSAKDSKEALEPKAKETRAKDSKAKETLARASRTRTKESKEVKKTPTDDGEAINRQWHEKIEAASSTEAVDYALEAIYKLDQVIKHPVFGLGVVIKVIPPGKIEVIFERFYKILVMNVGRTSKL
ncbi:MAG: hypothetical protein LBV23_08615 [Deltaproteobacteria bacterium]|jgi:hypothetical protein|nr:hypothetical protein [Deltaproteobacteria bacterium]